MDTAWSREEPPLILHKPSCHPDSGCLFCSPNPYPVYMGSTMHDTPGTMSLPDYWDADEYSTFSQPATNFLAAPDAAQSWAFATTESAFPPPDFTGTSTSNPQGQQTLQNEPVTTIHPSLANTWFPGTVPIRLANPNSAAVANVSAIQNPQPTAHGTGDDYISDYTNLPIPLQPFSSKNLNPFAYTTPHSSLSQDIFDQDIFNQGAFDQDAFDQDSSHNSQYTSSYRQIPQNAFSQDSSRFVSSVNMTHMPQEVDGSGSDLGFAAGSLSSQLNIPTPASAADSIPNLRAVAWQNSRSQEPKGPAKARHNRKPKFGPERLKTQQVRKVGSCTLCKLHHDSCKHDGPCKRCVDAAQKAYFTAQRFEALTLAERICARDDESAFTARIKIIDYLELKSRDYGPPLTCDKCPTKSFSIKLIHPPEVNGDKVYHFQGLPLTIVVEECVTIEDILGSIGIKSWSTAPTSTLESLFEDSKALLTDKLVADMKEKLALEDTSKCHSELCFLQKIAQNYQIRPDSLPTMKQLVEWGALDVAQKAREFPNDAESVLDAILHRYVNKAPPGPLTSLVQNVVSMTNLGRYLDSRRPIDQAKFEYYKAKGLDDRLFRVSAISKRTRDQLFKQAARGFESLEKLVLPEIDLLLPAWRVKAKTPNPLILGLCVRRLALQYRRSMVRYKQFGEAQETRKKNAQDMYDTMTRHYARVFKGTLSPFREDWQTANQNDALLKDDVLVALFEQFKFAEACHYQHDLNRADDGVYLAMFAERLNKRQTCPARMWEKVDTRSNIAAVG